MQRAVGQSKVPSQRWEMRRSNNRWCEKQPGAFCVGCSNVTLEAGSVCVSASVHSVVTHRKQSLDMAKWSRLRCLCSVVFDAVSCWIIVLLEALGGSHLTSDPLSPTALRKSEPVQRLQEWVPENPKSRWIKTGQRFLETMLNCPYDHGGDVNSFEDTAGSPGDVHGTSPAEY